MVTHELGHELGLDDTDGGGVMATFLAPGTRRLPGPDHPAGPAAAGPSQAPADPGLRLAAWAAFQARPASGGSIGLPAFAASPTDASPPVISSPPFMAAVGKGDRNSWASEAEVFDHVFGVSSALLGEALGDDLAVAFLG